MEILKLFVDNGIFGYFYNLYDNIKIIVYPSLPHVTVIIDYKIEEEYYTSSIFEVNNFSDLKERLEELVDTETCNRILFDISRIADEDVYKDE